MQKPQPNNPQPRLNTKGFGLVGVLLILLALTVVAGAGVYVYHRGHKGKTAVSTTTGSTSTTTTKPTSTSVDPYVGWKTYADTTYHYSFRYPAGWSLTTSSTQGVAASVRNPGNSVLVSYANPFVKDSSMDNFLAADIEDMPSSSSLKIVGGALTANNLPTYAVVDASLLTSHPLTVGQTAQFDTAPRFTDKGSSNSGQLTAYPVGVAFTTTGQAQVWLASADAKTSLLILESLTYQH